MNDELLTVSEVMALLRCSERYAYQRMRHWPPGFTVRLGRKLLVSRTRLLEWIEAGGDAKPKHPTRSNTQPEQPHTNAQNETRDASPLTRIVYPRTKPRPAPER